MQTSDSSIDTRRSKLSERIDVSGWRIRFWKQNGNTGIQVKSIKHSETS